MLAQLKSQLQTHLQESLKESYPQHKLLLPAVELDHSADKIHGEFSCNIALKSSKILGKSPLDSANEFVQIFQKFLSASSLKEKIAKIEVKKPGFINFFLTPAAFYDVILEIFKEDKKYGSSPMGEGRKILIEFVSANPTGPLTIAHARQASVGDALAHIFNFLGFKVDREYFVNDEGNQINILGRSLECRVRELLGESVIFPEDGYQGGYIKDMAQVYLEKNKIKSPGNFSEFGVDYLMEVIKKDLEDFRVRFENWAYQSKVATKENIEAIFDYLKKKGFLYEKEGALWFKSTGFGDDKDRVVEKSDGSYTYLAPDMVYHKNKFERGFDKLINIWGPDHHGYIPRMKAFVEALGEKKEALEILIVQLATLYKEGNAVSMSTRRGQFVTLREVIDEVGVDAARFFFLMRHIDAHLDFDLELAKKESPENPVYYIQYAHARIHSIDKKAKEIGLKPKMSNFQWLKEEKELDLIKNLGMFPDILVFCYEQMDPYPLVSFLLEAATSFHKFYDQHRVVDEAQMDVSSERLSLCHATKTVLANGLRLLGLSTPEKM